VVIEMRDVTKRYGDVRALDGIDLDVAAGEVVAVLGPNGAGKTTAIAVMLGLTRPTSGSVRCFGGDPARGAARSRVGVMLQESGVPDALRVREVVGLFQRYYPYTLPLDELLARADLAGKRDALVSTLSGGQRQRLYFALAIAGDPDLVFLDEPTVALDVSARRAFWEQVEGFAELGKTVLFSTHYLDEADAVARRVVVVDHGRVIAEGTPREIKRLVADTTVRFHADVALEHLRALPHVQRAELEEGFVVIATNEPEALLARLFADGLAIRDLRVTDTDLEAAFVHLTNGGAMPASAVPESVGARGVQA
jgi:ABC-2 type transport system ATP-binding protein